MAKLHSLIDYLNVKLQKIFIEQFHVGSDANRFSSNYISNSSPIIIGGCARSGTTLMRVILDSHPNLCAGPESWLFVLHSIDIDQLAMKFDLPAKVVKTIFQNANSRAEFIDCFFNEYCRARSKQRWVEKTPKNVTKLNYIFQAYPHARFIHMLRDGRDVACSLRAKKDKLSLQGAIQRWKKDIETSRNYWNDPRYLGVRYEDLVRDTRLTLENIFSFIEEPWDDRVLKYYQVDRDFTVPDANEPNAGKPPFASSIGRWKQELSSKDIKQIKNRAGYLLEELGYGEW